MSAALADMDTMTDLQRGKSLAAIPLELYLDLPSKYKTCFPQSGASRHKTLGTLAAMGLPLFCLSKSTFWMNNRAPLHSLPPLSNYISTTTSVLSIKKGRDQFINISKWGFCRTERLPRDQGSAFLIPMTLVTGTSWRVFGFDDALMSTQHYFPTQRKCPGTHPILTLYEPFTNFAASINYNGPCWWWMFPLSMLGAYLIGSTSLWPEIVLGRAVT